jgi:hypothetical protein
MRGLDVLGAPVLRDHQNHNFNKALFKRDTVAEEFFDRLDPI